MGPLKLTFCESASSPDRLIQESFESLVSLSQLLDDAPTFPDTQSSKKPSDLPLLVPVSGWSELYRKDKNVTEMARLFSADFDRVTPEKRDEILSKLEPYEYIFYSSWNHRTAHKDGLECFRVLISLEKPYPVEEFLRLFRVFEGLFGGSLDVSTKKPSLGYFLPAIREGHEDKFEMFHHPGRAFPLDKMVAVEPISKPDQEVLCRKGPKVDALLPLVESTFKSWANYRGREEPLLVRKALGKDLVAIMAGKPPKSVTPGRGERHGWMVRLAGTLARAFPDNTTESIVAPLNTDGWKTFEGGDTRNHGLMRLRGMVEDFQESELEKREQRRLEREEEFKEILKEQTGGKRDHLVTPEECHRLEERYGKNWRKYAVLQTKGAYFLMQPDGNFGLKAWDRNEVMLAARDAFTVFGDEVSVSYESDGKVKKHTLGSFMDSYGTALKDVWYDQTVTESVFNKHDKTLAIACAKHKVEAKYHEDVQEWLEQMGGPLLLDMTAGLTRTTEQLPALILTGPAGSGKTLFATAAGQIFGTTPLEPKDTFSQFNAHQTIRQPITLHDEKAGAEYKKEGTTLVRRFITQRERWVEEKYMPKLKLRGFPRLIFCGNNEQILDTDEDMTAQDREAFAQRLVHIKLEQRHVEYCKKNLARTRKWLETDAISEHMLWLGENHQIQNKGERFLVGGPKTQLHESIAGGAGTAAEVVQWLLCYLADPTQIDANGSNAIEILSERQELRVTAQTIFNNWDVYLSGSRVPRISRIQVALKSISHEKRQKVTVNVPGGTSRNLSCRSVRTDLLRARLRDHHLTVEDFDEVLGFNQVTPPEPEDTDRKPKLELVG